MPINSKKVVKMGFVTINSDQQHRIINEYRIDHRISVWIKVLFLE